MTLDFLSDDFRPDLQQLFSCQILRNLLINERRCCNSVNKSSLQFSGHTPQPCPAQGCLFARDTLIGGFESTRIPQMPLVEFFALVMLRKLVLQLQDRFSREIMEQLSSHSTLGQFSFGDFPTFVF